MTSGVGLLAYAVVGLMTLPTGIVFRLSWWWLSLAVGLLLFGVLRSEWVSRSAARYLLAPLFAASVATYLLAPDYAFSAVPMVVVAATGAFLLPLWAALLLVAAQTLVVAAVWSGGRSGHEWRRRCDRRPGSGGPHMPQGPAGPSGLTPRTTSPVCLSPKPQPAPTT